MSRVGAERRRGLSEKRELRLTGLGITLGGAFHLALADCSNPMGEPPHLRGDAPCACPKLMLRQALRL